MINVNIKTDFKNPNMKIPSYAHDGDAGFDFQANLMEGEHIVLEANAQATIDTGISVALPSCDTSSFVWEMQVRPRSGLAHKHEVTITNSPGTIDSGYRNKIGVIIKNTGSDQFVIEPGDRIAQGVLAQAFKASFNVVENLDDTERGQGGFGSSGVK